MTLRTRTLHPLFGVEVLDVEVTRVDEPVFKEIADDGTAHVTAPREVDIAWGRAQLEVV